MGRAAAESGFPEQGVRTGIQFVDLCDSSALDLPHIGLCGRADTKCGRIAFFTVIQAAQACVVCWLVRLLDAEGHELASAQVPAIPAPLDLLPKTAQVTLHVRSGARTAGAKVRVQLRDQTQEITQLNNEVVLP
jgi:hypothetical protein